MHREEQILRELIDNIQYDADLFKIYIDPDRYIMGCMSINSADSVFFTYKTIYDTIIDLDGKIKKSFDLALRWEYSIDIDKFNMIAPPSSKEQEAIYYTENAIFRSSVLWDLLAQLYNIKYKGNKNPDKVYYHSLFHNDTQGKTPNVFAQQVYAYISEEDNSDRVYEQDELWAGNHTYITTYRNKMTHRNSPNVSTISNYDLELRMPMRYVLKRAIEDYYKASQFIKSLLNIILADISTQVSEHNIELEDKTSC